MIIKAIIEMPKNSNYKYEVDKETGRLTIDRVLSVSIPCNYGYTPATLADDSDPLDVMVISQHPIVPLTEVDVRIIGVFKCKDKGRQDDKLVGILKGEFDAHYGYLDDIEDYLRTYKKGFVVESYGYTPVAEEVYQQALNDYAEACLKEMLKGVP